MAEPTYIKPSELDPLPPEQIDGATIAPVVKDGKTWKVDLSFVKTAADNANDKASLANTAAGNADTSANNADTAASNADTKAGLADTAATAANNAAGAATTAAGSANTAATAANDAATAANSATSAANTAAGNADAKTAELEAMRQLLEASWIRPTAMELDYPRTITLRNPVQKQIAVTLTPAGNYKNMLFIDDDNVIKVLPDGSILIRQTGNSKVHVIPTDNSSLYKTIDITVVEPGIRNITATSMRLTGSGAIRLT